MPASRRYTVAEAVPGTITITSVPAVATDIVMTAISLTEGVSGYYGLAQRILLFVGGMMFQSRRMGGGWNVFVTS
jgi:hypothetical protein